MNEQKVCGVCGHVAQLTQSISQLALPPSQEEARAEKLVAVLEVMPDNLMHDNPRCI